jgi:hypothetical protein
MGVKKRCVATGGKNHFQKGGGGINIVFGPKYRPLEKADPDPYQTSLYPQDCTGT